MTGRTTNVRKHTRRTNKGPITVRKHSRKVPDSHRRPTFMSHEEETYDGLKLFGKCSCGAIAMEDGDGNRYNMTPETFRERYGTNPARLVGLDRWGNCDHCVNNWGIDLCACGSGEKPGDCEEGFSMCGTPMQNIDEGVTRPGMKW